MKHYPIINSLLIALITVVSSPAQDRETFDAGVKEEFKSKVLSRGLKSDEKPSSETEERAGTVMRSHIRVKVDVDVKQEISTITEKDVEDSKCKVIKGASMEFKEILFNFDSTTFLEPLKTGKLLLGISEALKEFPESRILIEGHSCDLGADLYNVALSYFRAAYVRDYLVEKGGIAADRFEVLSFGEKDPAIKLTGKENLREMELKRSNNRRVIMRLMAEGTTAKK
jgi:outer membrane protein OmpA-like peptidoglycan-associated protein